jgi:hypothetical protein
MVSYYSNKLSGSAWSLYHMSHGQLLRDRFLRLSLLYGFHVTWSVTMRIYCIHGTLVYSIILSHMVSYFDNAWSGSVYSTHLMSHGPLLWQCSVMISILYNLMSHGQLLWQCSCQDHDTLSISCCMVSYYSNTLCQDHDTVYILWHMVSYYDHTLLRISILHTSHVTWSVTMAPLCEDQYIFYIS